MKYYCGLDVSLNSTAACVVNQDGAIIRESEVASEPGAIDQWLKSLGLPMERVGMEAGGLSSWLCEELLALGCAVICIEFRASAP
jgi:transposase